MSFSTGDKLNSRTFNKRVREIAPPMRSGGSGGASLGFQPFIIFRQENSSFPSASESFPVFYAPRPLVILGGFGLSETGDFEVVINSDTAHTPDSDLMTYSSASEVGGEKYLLSSENGYVNKNDKIFLKVTDVIGDVSGFQFNIITKMLL